MRVNLSVVFTPPVLILSVIPFLLDTETNEVYIPFLRFLFLSINIVLISLLFRKEYIKYDNYFLLLIITLSLFTLKEVLIVINNILSLLWIDILVYILTTSAYLTLLILLIWHMWQFRTNVSTHMRVITITLSFLIFAFLAPVYIEYYNKLIELQSYLEFSFSIVYLLIFFLFFALGFAFLYIGKELKATVFWISIVGGYFLLFGGDTIYRYFTSHESYVYGSYADIFSTLAYGAFLIGTIFLSQKENLVATISEVAEEREHYKSLYLELHNIAADFLSVTSLFKHDLLNDLSVVQGYMDVLEHSEDDDVSIQVTKRLETAVEKVKKLGSSSETLSSLRIQPIKLNSISELVSVFDNAEFLPSTNDVEIETSTLLFPIIFNLIQNAFQHGGESVKVQVETSINTEKVYIRVKDNGVGILDEDKPYVFTRAFRKSDKGVGGMGLYLIHNIIERFEGKISVSDNKPKGTVFTIDLPRFPSQSDEQ